ncbi:hypothetical protein SARC_15789, partial [Sphaeroforma arctica JP610]
GDRVLLERFFRDSCEAVVWYWAVCQCASYAVRNRLKTSFGGPSQTLIALETGFSAMVKGPVGAGRDGLTHTQRLAISTVFVEVLEKHVLTAVFGSGGLGSPEKSVAVFYAANSK